MMALSVQGRLNFKTPGEGLGALVRDDTRSSTSNLIPLDIGDSCKS